MSNQKTRVGFVGLGIMGRSMARNVAQSGFELRVFNRTREKADALAAEVRCEVATSPMEAASDADIVVTMVSDAPDVEQVYLADGGIIHGAREGSICVDMSTVGPDCALRIAAELKTTGLGFVDAPVSGGSWGAEQGTLSIMAGGSEMDLQRCTPLFEAMGKTIVHCGPVGTGQTTKLANQIVGALTLEAVCEGILFSLRSGADLDKVLAAVGAGASASWSWNNLGPRIVKQDFAPGFKINHMIKDLKLAILAGERAGVKLPGTGLVLQHLQSLQASGKGELGTQALLAALTAT